MVCSVLQEINCITYIHRYLFIQSKEKKKKFFSFVDLFHGQMPANVGKSRAEISDGLFHDFVIIITTTNGRR